MTPFGEPDCPALSGNKLMAQRRVKTYVWAFKVRQRCACLHACLQPRYDVEPNLTPSLRAAHVGRRHREAQQKISSELGITTGVRCGSVNRGVAWMRKLYIGLQVLWDDRIAPRAWGGNAQSNGPAVVHGLAAGQWMNGYRRR